MDFYKILGFQKLLNEVISKAEFKYTILGTSETNSSEAKKKDFFNVLIDNCVYMITSELKQKVIEVERIYFRDSVYGHRNILCIQRSIKDYEIDGTLLTTVLPENHLVSAEYYKLFYSHLDELKTVHFENFIVKCNYIADKYKEVILPLLQSYFELKIYKTSYYYRILKFFNYYQENKKDEWSLIDSDEKLGHHLPEDFTKLAVIISDKIVRFDGFEISNTQMKFILKKKIIELSFERNLVEFEQSFPKVKNTDTKNIENIIKEIYSDDIWIQLYQQNLSVLAIYFLTKNKLFYNLKDEQMYQIYLSISHKYEQFRKNYETNYLEKELLEEINRNSSQCDENKEYKIEMIDLMTGIEFERFCEKIFTKMGYKVTSTSVTGDQGIDLIAINLNEKIGVQAKRYSTKVSNKAVQEVVAGLNYYNLNKGLVITNHYFTDSAIKLAAKNNIILWDRDMLIIKIKELNSR